MLAQAKEATAAAAHALSFAGAPLPAAMQPPQHWHNMSIGQAAGPDPGLDWPPQQPQPPQQQQLQGDGWVEEGEEASDAQDAMQSR